MASVTKENYAALSYAELFGLSDDDCGTGELSAAVLARVRKAFRRLSVRFHPDKDPSPEARLVFERIKEAADTLTDPVRAKAHFATEKASATEVEKRARRDKDAARGAEALQRREEEWRAEQGRQRADAAKRAAEATGAVQAGVDALRTSLMSSWEQLEADMVRGWEVGPDELDAKMADVARLVGSTAYKQGAKRPR